MYRSDSTLFFYLILMILLLFSSPLEGVSSSFCLEEQGRIYYYQGDLKKARDLYISLLEEEEDHSNYYHLAIIYMELNQDREALHLLLKLHSLYPDDPRWLRELGIFYHNRGAFLSAREALERSLLLIPHRETYYYLGLSQWELGDYHSSHESLKEAIYHYPTFALAYYQLARLYDSLQMIEEAIDYYHLALKYDSSMTEIHTLLGERYLELGDLQRAYHHFQRAVMVHEDSLSQARLMEMEHRFPHLFPLEEEEDLQDFEELQWIKREPDPSREETPVVRVMLLEGVEELHLMTSGPFLLRDGPGGDILEEGEGEKSWQIKRGSHSYALMKGDIEITFTESLYMELSDPSDIFLLFHILYGHGYFWAGLENRQYRGDLEIRVRDDGMMAINHLHIEEYLYSVVPSEMPASWPLEALKAQAVAARSYTLRRLGGEEYDLCSTVLSAVYRGLMAEHPQSTAAVDATRGEVLFYEDQMIDALYSSNVGGHTESSASIWGGERAYLQPVSTDYTPLVSPLSPGDLRNWLMEASPSYSNSSFTGPNIYRWVRSFPVERLEELLSMSPIKDIRVLSRAHGGSVLSLAIIGEEEERIFKGSSIRSFFHHLRSTRFSVERIFHQEGHLKEILLYGGGFGHGVGMGQSEAAAMAREGYSYLDILHLFYQNVEQRVLY